MFAMLFLYFKFFSIAGLISMKRGQPFLTVPRVKK